MQSVFLKIYRRLLLSLLLTAMLAVSSIYLINQFRISQYIEFIAGSVFHLLAEDLSHLEGESQKQDLAQLNRITNLRFVLEEELIGRKAFRVQTNLNGRKLKISQKLPGSSLFLQTRTQNLNEPFAREITQVILVDIAKYSTDKRPHRLQQITELSPYSIRKVAREKLTISPAQNRRLDRGEVLVEKSEDGEDSLMTVYAAIGKNRREALVLGPLPVFVMYPPTIMGAIFIIVLLSAGLSGILVMRPIEKKLQMLISSVDKIGTTDTLSTIEIPGDTEFKVLTDHINAMSQRINTLMANQAELTHAVSHELRTPIARLRFRLELLEEDLNKEERVERIKGITSDINELNSLVDEILGYAKIKTEVVNLKRQNLSCSDVIEELRFKTDPIRKNISLNFHSDIDTLYADRLYMTRALLNLITNAIKYAKKEVNISFYRQGDDNIIKVEDDGSGIPEEKLELIFEPFSRIDDSRNKELGGFGLGLSITQQIIQWHGATISASQSSQGGALFKIILPKKI